MCYNPVHCITPPHIIQAMVHRGDEKHKSLALNTLHCTEKFRGHRDVLAQHNLTTKKKLKGKDFGKHRVVQSANNEQIVQGKVIRREGDAPSGDLAADEAYQHTGEVYDFFWDVFKRNSIDGLGMKIFSTVHYSNNFDNAFWNGERMVFGDGDGQIFNRFTTCLEVIGHELTHGITNATANLVYHGQSGALNESVSDVFGVLVKQKTLNQNVRRGSWIIGEGLFTKEVNGVGVRSLSEPGTAYDDAVLGKDPCPATMSDYVETKSDNGGVHINCCIPSHAFYLACMELGGHAWEHMGWVWYNTLTRRLKAKADFQTFADTTLRVCKKLFGNGAELTALNNAWKSVKVI